MPARRLRRRRDQGRGHRRRRLHALDAAALRGRRPERRRLGVFGAQPRQALDPDRSQVGGRGRGAAAPRTRCRRAAGVVQARRDGSARRRLRAAARAEPTARVLRDHRLRSGRAPSRPRRPRHELPGARRAARPHRRARRSPDPGRGPDRGPWRGRADGGGRDPDGAARTRSLGPGPARGLLDVRRRAVVARARRRRADGHWRRPASRRAAAGGPLQLLPPVSVRGRLGVARGARAEVLERVVHRRRPR